MHNYSFSLLDTVTLLIDLPKENLSKGKRGTIVHIFDDSTFEVEFLDSQGYTTNLVSLPIQFLSI